MTEKTNNNKSHGYILLIVMTLIVLLAIAAVLLLTKKKEEDTKTVQGTTAQGINTSTTVNVLGSITSPGQDTEKKYNSVNAVNNDIKGWLTVPNTTIDSAVFQRSDNNYYSGRNEHRNKSIYGSYYFDSSDKIGNRNEISKVVIIYGKSSSDNPDGKRFAQLFRFSDAKFASKTPYIYLTAGNDTITYRVFASYYADSGMSFSNQNPNNQEFFQIVENAYKNTKVIYGAGVNRNDKILVLSTPSEKYKGKNFVVLARTIRVGEKTPSTIDAEINS